MAVWTITNSGNTFLNASYISNALQRPSNTWIFFPPGVNTGFVKEEALCLLRTNSSRSTFNNTKACVARKSYFFGWVGRDGTVSVLNVFILVTEKSITFKERKYRRNTEKNRIHLNSHRNYVIYCLYCLNISKLKWNASVPRSLFSTSQPLFGLPTQRPLFPVIERARCVTRVTRETNKRLVMVAKETTLTAIPLTERNSKLFVYS